MSNSSNEVKEAADLGRACLLSGKPYESLTFYAKAVQLSLNENILQRALSINQTLNPNAVEPENDWNQRLLLLGLAAKFPFTLAGKAALIRIKELISGSDGYIKPPVVIVAGGCRPEVEAQMSTYQNLILESFASFNGTIISGGTTSGVSGLVGDVQQTFPNTIRTVGYVPKGKKGLLDKRYSEIRFTQGEEFSPLEPLQYWTDLLAIGIKLSEVKVIGIDGGRMSAFEYRLALALEGLVAVIKGSGAEIGKLLSEIHHNNKPHNLFAVSASSKEIQKFLKT
jgi:hypothetical protein